MKSAESKKACPVCGIMVSVEFTRLHIAQQGRIERESNLQTERKHWNYIRGVPGKKKKYGKLAQIDESDLDRI